MALYNGDNSYKGKALFRAALLDSGSVVPADPVDCPRAEDIYNTVMDKCGCSRATDTLACLRTIDYETFLEATTSIAGAFDYQSVALPYLPRPDGSVLTQSPDILALNGKFASVPFKIGEQGDEGTLFFLVRFNISTTDDPVQYLSTVFFHNATVEQVQALVAAYPDDPSAGSPYNTGAFNELYPQYKRLASILGDIALTPTRRVFLNIASSVHPFAPLWPYLASYDYCTPVLGIFHASYILTTYGITPGFATTSIQNYYISFFNTMPSNFGMMGLPSWPK
jgi:carboxylesterase type B